MTENPPKTKQWTTEDWKKYWNDGACPEVATEYNEHLLGLERTLFPGADKKYTVLLPLCGKSNDMEWLAKKGHSVIGIDCSDAVLKDFFKEHGLEYSERSEGNFKVFSSTNPEIDINLYAGDIYDLPAASFAECNIVWDYASIVVIKPEDREKYVKAVSSKLSRNANYLLCAFNFERFEIPHGPAYQTSPEMVQGLFGKEYEITQLHEIVSEHEWKGKPVAMKEFYHMVKKVSGGQFPRKLKEKN